MPVHLEIFSTTTHPTDVTLSQCVAEDATKCSVECPDPDTPNPRQRTSSDCCVALHRPCLDQNVALEYTAKTRANRLISMYILRLRERK